jgi:hypothetical protein
MGMRKSALRMYSHSFCSGGSDAPDADIAAPEEVIGISGVLVLIAMWGPCRGIVIGFFDVI